MRIGILGGGQLGRMLALAGYPLGLRFRFFDHSAQAPAGHLAELQVGEFEDSVALERFAADLDVVTYEFENVPLASVQRLAERLRVYPPPRALEVSQERLTEKTFFRELGVPTAPFEPVDGRADLTRAAARLGLPAVLKTRRHGYDGKGQTVLRTSEDVARGWDTFGQVPLILEGFVRFARELSLLAVRGLQRQICFYPLVENHHRAGMLRLSHAPALNAERLQTAAEDFARRLLEALDYVGVLALELFEVDGQLLANEMAPRVHNSGHWTIEGAATSQFENHLRAILGWPLGSTEMTAHAAMVNLIGVAPTPEKLLEVRGARLHWYGKTEKAGRKVGHDTLLGQNRLELDRRVAAVIDLLPQC
jgi:5-(carboxyamino)imidazole ribonucleotide synthase